MEIIYKSALFIFLFLIPKWVDCHWDVNSNQVTTQRKQRAEAKKTALQFCPAESSLTLPMLNTKHHQYSWGGRERAAPLITAHHFIFKKTIKLSLLCGRNLCQTNGNKWKGQCWPVSFCQSTFAVGSGNRALQFVTKTSIQRLHKTEEAILFLTKRDGTKKLSVAIELRLIHFKRSKYSVKADCWCQNLEDITSSSTASHGCSRQTSQTYRCSMRLCVCVLSQS